MWWEKKQTTVIINLFLLGFVFSFAWDTSTHVLSHEWSCLLCALSDSVFARTGWPLVVAALVSTSGPMSRRRMFFVVVVSLWVTCSRDNISLHMLACALVLNICVYNIFFIFLSVTNQSSIPLPRTGSNTSRRLSRCSLLAASPLQVPLTLPHLHADETLSPWFTHTSLWDWGCVVVMPFLYSVSIRKAACS